MNYLKKVSLFRLAFSIILVGFLSACGNDTAAPPNTTVTKIPTPLQKLEVGQGVLSAYVLLDGGRRRFPMVINNVDNTASVTLTGLTREVHNILITYEYTDDNGSFILAQSPQRVDLSTGSQTRNVEANDYGFAFDEDNDGITNTDELLVGTDPRSPALGSGNIVTLFVETTVPVLSDSARNAGTLRAFVVIEGIATPVELVINAETGVASASINDVRQLPRNYTVTFEYTDTIGTITVANIEGTLDLRFETELKLAINDFNFVAFNEDGDGASNAYELSVGGNPRVVEIPTVASNVRLVFEQTKLFHFEWDGVEDATFYRLFENKDGVSTNQLISGDIRGEKIFDHKVPLYARLKAQYMLQSCNDLGCIDSEIIGIEPTDSLVGSIGYFKSDGSIIAGERLASYNFGASVSLSDDGLTLAVGDAKLRASIFNFINGKWSQQTLLRGSNELVGNIRPNHVALSGNGNTLAIAVPFDFNNAVGVKELLPPDANGFVSPVYIRSGAIYVFALINGSWGEQAFIKASNLEADDLLGSDISISDDGNTLVIGAPGEDSDLAGSISGAFQDNNASIDSGAVYVFSRNIQGAWNQQTFIKASTNNSGDGFGSSVSLSGDGLTLVVGAPNENSNATSVGGDQLNSGASASGAVYVFNLNQQQNTWSQNAYVKASNTEADDHFGSNVELNKAGSILAVTASGEDSSIRSDQSDNRRLDVGAVYVFERDGIVVNGNDWVQQDYIKLEVSAEVGLGNPRTSANFGSTLSLNDEGDLLAIGDANESNGDGVGFNSNSISTFSGVSGAAYVFKRNIRWAQQAYIKAINTEGGIFPGTGDLFGSSISLSGDSTTLAVGAQNENGTSTGINSVIDETTDTVNNFGNATTGAVYLY